MEWKPSTLVAYYWRSSDGLGVHCVFRFKLIQLGEWPFSGELRQAQWQLKLHVLHFVVAYDFASMFGMVTQPEHQACTPRQSPCYMHKETHKISDASPGSSQLRSAQAISVWNQNRCSAALVRCKGWKQAVCNAWIHNNRNRGGERERERTNQHGSHPSNASDEPKPSAKCTWYSCSNSKALCLILKPAAMLDLLHQQELEKERSAATDAFWLSIRSLHRVAKRCHPRPAVMDSQYIALILARPQTYYLEKGFPHVQLYVVTDKKQHGISIRLVFPTN
eukprot:3340425-Amphidinium_carterae.1